MASPISNLRILDRSAAARELDLASELFHRINRIIPQDQSVLTCRGDFFPVWAADCLVRVDRLGNSNHPGKRRFVISY